MSRSKIPPMPWLAAFESVARTGSVTVSAHELDLTQGAVSRQVQKLEGFLGVELFTRDRKRLKLTPVGVHYAARIRDSLTQISNVTSDIKKNPLGGALELAVLPAFGAHWLAPRLKAFQGHAPEVTVNFTTRLSPFDFSQERFQAAIHFGRDDWPDAQSLHLLDEKLTPVFAASLSQGAVLEPSDLAQLPLIHLESRPRAWSRWMRKNDVDADTQSGMVVDQFEAMLQAAAVGLGVALIPSFLMKDAETRFGLQVLPKTHAIESGAYYLVWPEGMDAYPPLTSFRTWLEGVIR